MQNLIQQVLEPTGITYLIVKISVLLVVLLIWILVGANPVY